MFIIKLIKRIFGSQTLDQEMEEEMIVNGVKSEEISKTYVLPKDSIIEKTNESLSGLMERYRNSTPFVLDFDKHMEDVAKKDPKELQKIVDTRLKEIRKNKPKTKAKDKPKAKKEVAKKTTKKKTKKTTKK